MNQGAIGLRAWRDGEGLTQRAAADRLGIDPSFLSWMERGARKPGADLMHKIEEVTKVPMQAWFEVAAARSRRPPRAA